MNDPIRIGIIGLGVMGGAMAKVLLTAGYSLTVTTRSRERAQALLDAGAAWQNDAAAVARASDVVITALPDEDAVRQVVTGTNGILVGTHAGLVWVDTSTISASTARELADTAAGVGIRSLDAPVSGGEPAAQAGTLAVMVGGPRDVFERCESVLRRLGQTVVYMGGSGSGQVAKLCNQIVVGVTIAAVAESLSLGAKAGVDPAKLREVMMGGFASSRVLELHGRRMIEGDFQPGGRIQLHRKDLDIALRVANEVEVTVPLSSLVLQLMHASVVAGEGELDHSALVRVYERLSGVVVSASSGL